MDGINFEAKLTRDQFEVLCMDLFHNTIACVKKAVKEAKMENSQIQEIVLVGGSTRIPKIKQLLSYFFNGKALNRQMNPEEAAVFGLTIQAAILSEDKTELLKDMMLLDALPHSLGIETPLGTMAILLKRNTMIPTSASRRLNFPNQNPVVIKVCEGENLVAKANRFLAEFTVDNAVQDVKPGGGIGQAIRSQMIEVSFDIDANSCLTVKATHVTSRKEAEIVVNRKMKRLSTEDIQLMNIQAKRFRSDEQEQERLKLINSVINLANLTKENLNDPRLNVVTSDLKQQIADKCDEVLGWIENNPGAKVDQLQYLQTEIESLSTAISSQVYEAANCLMEPSFLAMKTPRR